MHKTSLKFLRILLGLTLLLLITDMAMAKDKVELEAKKDTALYAEPSKTAAKVKGVKKGDTIIAHERTGLYWKVDDGYVAVMDMSRKASKDGGASNVMRELVKERDKTETESARNRTGVMGVRGLDESGDVSFAGNVKPNLRLVFALEDMRIYEDEIKGFEEEVLKEIEKKSMEKVGE